MRTLNKVEIVNGMPRCAICGGLIDRGACNQDYGTFTAVRDTDEGGRINERAYLCHYCVNKVASFITGQHLEASQMEGLAR